MLLACTNTKNTLFARQEKTIIFQLTITCEAKYFFWVIFNYIKQADYFDLVNFACLKR